jgi:8-oxo-dGTP pyrophosphatase MutT (NUDIX family)|tara:strand:+ start:2120 stop:2557 length:438 start_codon:yes stop_codon:yes gene_type:complete
MKETNIICSGAIVYAQSTKRFLFLHRVKGRAGNLWGLVGGTNEGSETPWEGLKREIFEEIGKISIKKTMPLETFISNDSRFHFHTYLCVVDQEFIPTLNDEHDGYAWCSFSKWPKPLHHGLSNTLQNKVNLQKLETVFKVIDLLD